MAIIDSSTWSAATGQSLSGADATALSAVCLQVSAALTRRLLPYSAEPLTATAIVMNAPLSEMLQVLRPLKTVSSIYYRSDADGVVANFTSDYLLASDGSEYVIEVDDPPTGWSRAGLIRRTGRRTWGAGYRREVGTLGNRLVGEPRCLLLTYTYGEASVPGDIAAAAVAAVTLLMNRRKTGAPLQSESFGGYSYSAAGPHTAEAAINAPDVVELLRPYVTPKFA